MSLKDITTLQELMVLVEEEKDKPNPKLRFTKPLKEQLLDSDDRFVEIYVTKSGPDDNGNSFSFSIEKIMIDRKTDTVIKDNKVIALHRLFKNLLDNVDDVYHTKEMRQEFGTIVEEFEFKDGYDKISIIRTREIPN